MRGTSLLRAASCCSLADERRDVAGAGSVVVDVGVLLPPHLGRLFRSRGVGRVKPGLAASTVVAWLSESHNSCGSTPSAHIFCTV